MHFENETLTLVLTVCTSVKIFLTHSVITFHLIYLNFAEMENLSFFLVIVEFSFFLWLFSYFVASLSHTVYSFVFVTYFFFFCFKNISVVPTHVHHNFEWVLEWFGYERQGCVVSFSYSNSSELGKFVFVASLLSLLFSLFFLFVDSRNSDSSQCLNWVVPTFSSCSVPT